MGKVFILMGPPGCGKGTQTANIVKELGLPHIDTGSLLRKNVKEGTAFGLEAKSYMDKGQLVPIEVVANIIKDRLQADDCKQGYVLDGFPRNLEQAKALEGIQADLDYGFENVAIYFDIPTSILVERLVNRRYCPECGAIYNLLSKKPQEEGICDICKTAIAQRNDDNEETAKLRFETYENETAPLLGYFEEKGILNKVDANKQMKEVWEQIKEIIAWLQEKIEKK